MSEKISKNTPSDLFLHSSSKLSKFDENNLIRNKSDIKISKHNKDKSICKYSDLIKSNLKLLNKFNKPKHMNNQENKFKCKKVQKIQLCKVNKVVPQNAEIIKSAASISTLAEKQSCLPILEIDPELVLKELSRVSRQVEPLQISSDKNGNKDAVIRFTYKAILAKKGYLVLKTLGAGSYSKVKRAVTICKSNVVEVAVKIIDYKKAATDYQEKFMPREIQIWPQLSHPNIVNFYEKFQDSRRMYMVHEYASGGDTLLFIKKNGSLSEEVARSWIEQICQAIAYLHENCISHRDIKLENLLIDSKGNLKLCDFGFVTNIIDKSVKEKVFSCTYCGSKSYAAPEILLGNPYDAFKVDVWAVGVVLYIFITGRMPFDETKGTKSILLEQEKLQFPWHPVQELSSEVKKLVLLAMTWEFTRRPNITEILEHPWFIQVKS